MPRPRTTTKWEPASARFTDQEMKKLDRVTRSSGISRAEFMRRATMEKVEVALKRGRLEFPVSPTR